MSTIRNSYRRDCAQLALPACDSAATADPPAPHAAARAANTAKVKQRAAGLLLIALLGVVSCSGSAAEADSRGAIGSTSEASIGIAVSISPRVRFATAQVRAAQTVEGVTSSGTGSICLTTNMAQGRFAVAIEPTDSYTSVDTSAPTVAMEALASSDCALASTAPSQGMTTVALAFRPAAAPQSGSVHLTISPD